MTMATLIGGSIDRRTLLGAAFCAALSIPDKLRAGRSEGFFAQKHLPIGLQATTLREDMKRDAGRTLLHISSLGFGTVELGGLYGHSPQQMRRYLAAASLSCHSIHIEPTGDILTLDGDLDRVAAAAHGVGASTVVMPIFLYPVGFPAPSGANPMAMVRAAGRAMTADDYRRNADFLNRIGGKLGARGLGVGYHNHNVELEPKNGRSGLDILITETDRAHVSFEMDIGWVAAAGMDPIELLARYPGRFRHAHVKDIEAGTPANFELNISSCAVGAGLIPWQSVIPAAYAAGIRDFYVELEQPFHVPPIQSITESFSFLASLPAG